MRSLRIVLLAVALTVAMAAPAAARPAHNAAPAPSVAAPDFDLPAVQLRIQLSRVLAEHALLLIETMRAGLGDEDEFAAAASVLEENTVDLVTLVDAAYGADAADAFGTQWRNHIAYIVDYTRAVADRDTDARNLAADQLDTYVTDFSQLLAGANPSLRPEVVEGLIDEHVQQLEQVADFGDANYDSAYSAIRATYAHMFMVGDGLTLGILDRSSDRFPGQSVAFSRALDMRMTLDRLLGEHTMLAAFVMRARLSEGPDVDAAADALEANTADLTAQIQAIYGDAAAGAFGDMWRLHTGHYIDYVGAVADGDSAAQDTALDGLRAYQAEFSAFLAGANPFLSADALEGLLEMHTTHLIELVSSYHDGDIEGAYGTLREAYAQTETIAGGLAGAIADQFPERFSDTSVRAVTNDRAPIVGWILLIVAAVVVAGIGRRRLVR